MDTRCKRCFKKYDVSEDSCPRCGKLNAFDDDREHVSTSVREETHTMEKKAKGDFTCVFCGTQAKSNSKPCSECGSDHFTMNEAVSAGLYPYYKNLIDDYHRKAGSVDFEAFNEKIQLDQIPLDKWRFPKTFTAGTRMSIKQIGIAFIPFLFMYNTGDKSLILTLSILVVLLSVWFISIRYFRQHFITKDFEFKTTGQDIKITHSKDKKKLYSVLVKDITHVAVEIENDQLVKLDFLSNSKEAYYEIDCSKYIDFNYIKNILFLMCNEYKIPYEVKLI